MGLFDKAMASARRSMEITGKLARQFKGEEATLIRARSRTLIGTLNRQLGDYKQAEQYLKDALRLNLKQFGKDHVEVASSESNLGIVYKYSGQYAKGLALYESALAKLKAQFGDDGFELSMVYHNIGGVLHSAGRFAEGR